MSRWVAALLAIVAGGAFAFAAILGVVAVSYGFLWIYVFGDDSWPSWVEASLNIAIPLIGLAIWAVAAWLIWRRLAARR